MTGVCFPTTHCAVSVQLLEPVTLLALPFVGPAEAAVARALGLSSGSVSISEQDVVRNWIKFTSFHQAPNAGYHFFICMRVCHERGYPAIPQLDSFSYTLGSFVS